MQLNNRQEMYPSKFIERLKSQKYLDASKLLEALNKPSPVSIRINKTKWNNIPVKPEYVSWTKEGFYLESRPSFTSDPLFHSGCYYPQEASSMFVEEVYNQLEIRSENIRVLDLCAAPGGKSTHLSGLIGDSGFLVANDAIRPRAAVLSENITKWGIGNTIVTNNDPSAFSELKKYFDLILVDAPCSGEGMFSDHTVRSEWSVEGSDLCAERQRRILTDIWPSLKEGGYLIYSTCTFNPAENEENVKWFSDKVEATSVRIDISEYNGIQEISYEGIFGYGFYPGRIKGEGLFISVIRKKGVLEATPKQLKQKVNNPLTKEEIKIANSLINIPSENLYRHKENIYALALSSDEFLFLRNYLRIVKGGTALLKIRKDGFTPLHDLALSGRIREYIFSAFELDYQQSVSFLRKDNLTLNIREPGWILLNYKGVNLGFAKNLGTRINNYFPVEWRIRMNPFSISDANSIEWIDRFD
jgi:16S rRNA C967 or C1407 C5-methylase (RsmB/RsmF family)/NOL1/NOP2/fmu family ribosome biogenesis protein